MSAGHIRAAIEKAEHESKCQTAYLQGRYCYRLKQSGQSFQALWDSWTGPTISKPVRNAFLQGVNDA